MKKIISIITAVSLIFSIAVCSVFAESENEFEYCDEYKLIAELNIISESEWKGPMVTSGEFLRAAAVLRGFNGEIKDIRAAKELNGVLPGDSITKVIEFAVTQNIIDEVDEFYPDSDILGETAARILVNVLGYRPVVLAKDSYSGVGAYSKILPKGMSSQAIDVNTAAKMLYKAMKTNVLKISSYGANGGTGYEEGDMLIYEYLKLGMASGVMSETPYATLDSVYAAEGTVKIGTAILKTKDMDYISLIGRRVEAFVDEDNNIAAIMPLEDEYVVTVRSEDIESFSNSQLVYQKGNSTKRISYVTPTIIYNGRNLTATDFSGTVPIFNVEDGSVTLIKSTGNVYDTIIIESVTSIIVGAVDLDSNTVYDKVTAGTASAVSVTIDTEDNPAHILFDEKGNMCTLKDVEADDILSVAASIDGRVVKAKKSKNKLVAKPEYTETGKVVIEGQDYYTTSTFDAIGLSLQTTYIFYFSASGKAFFAELDSSFGTKAYLLSAKHRKKEDTVIIKCITADFDDKDLNTIHSIECAKKVRVDGVSKKQAEDIYNALTLWGGGSIVQMPIVYTTNSEGKIKTIDTPYYATGIENVESLHQIFTATSIYTRPMTTIGYSYGFGGRYTGKANALCVKPNTAYPEEIKLVKNTAAGSYDVTLFTLGKPTSRFADFCVFDSIVYKLDDTIAVVTKLTQSLYDEDEIVTNIKLRVGNKEYDLIIRDSDKAENGGSVASVNKGDMVQISFDNASGELKRMVVLYDYSSKTLKLPDDTSFGGADFRRIFGKVDNVEGNWVMLVPQGKTDTEMHYMKNDSLFQYYVEGGKVIYEKMSPKEIKSAEYYGAGGCDTIFFYTMYNVPNNAYIIR